MVLCACFADAGHQVIGLAGADASERLNRGEPLVHEPGLEELLRRNLESGRLSFTSDAAEALAGAELAFLSTDTPVDDRDVPQLDALEELAASIGEHAADEAVLVVTAQVPIGTTERLAALAVRRAAYAPEFLQLGTALHSFLEADRFVIGADDPDVAQRVASLYEPFGRPIVRTSIRTAEMAKHAANAFLATSISLINEIGDLADATGADVWAVAEILRLDHRIGPHAYLGPGLGFAGATLGRDLRALQALASERGIGTRVVDAVLAVNEDRAGQLVGYLARSLDGFQGKIVALLGLTYKPGTSTLRRSIGLEIAGKLTQAGADVRGFDPLADLGSVDAGLELAGDPLEAASEADAAVHLTGWDGLDQLDLAALRQNMRGNLFIDTRADFDPERMEAAGFRYTRFPAGAL